MLSWNQLVYDRKKRNSLKVPSLLPPSFLHLQFSLQFGECKRQQRVLQELMTLHQLKAFPETVAARSVRDGAQTLLMTSGLGGMRPNTLVIGFFDPDVQPREVFSFASTSEAREVCPCTSASLLHCAYILPLFVCLYDSLFFCLFVLVSCWQCTSSSFAIITLFQ